MEEKDVMQRGNIKLKVDKEKAKMQVYKCPFLNCPEYFLNYNDLQSHKILKHGETPAFFRENSGIQKGGFSMAKIRKLGFYGTKHIFNTYFTLLKLMVDSKPKTPKVKKVHA